MSDETTIGQAWADLEGDVNDATPQAKAAPRDERSTIADLEGDVNDATPDAVRDPAPKAEPKGVALDDIPLALLNRRVGELEHRLAVTVRALRDLADLLTNAGPPTKNARATVRTVLGDDSGSV